MGSCLQHSDHVLHGVHGKQDIEHRLALAEELCQKNGTRLTPLRREVLSLVLMANEPVGAYALLARLKRNEQRPAAPPTVYRTLDFLLEHGLVHRLASINAFIPCCHPRSGHQAAFIICNQCNDVKETSLNNILDDMVSESDFTVSQVMLEISGLCAQCRD